MLSINNLVCGYQQKEIIKGLSFTARPGESLGIIGPNGSGKTTLFRAITRIIPAWQGSITYQEKDIQVISHRDLARRIAVLPQFLNLSFPFLVRDFVALGRTPHLNRLTPLTKEDHNIIDSSMKQTDTFSFKDRRITELSGGELQRVLIAQALTQQPELLLLDEPMAHLDIGHQVEILDLLKKFNREKKLTLITVFHDLNLASEYCDRLVLLKDGQIYAQGTPAEVLTYQNIEAVYKTVVVVKENPITKKPHILLIPKDKWR
ncbi:MAG: ABC transporter ATP-binding protein [Planctomycetes bacterium]|nr:ABC transporter ATP-binding protein [Planctomycetota bacterium]